MSRLGRHLIVLVALVALTATVVALPRHEARPVTGPPLDSIPIDVGTWRGGDVTDETVLPVDTRSAESLRRLYQSGSRRAWLGVARYASRNGPDARPALAAFVPPMHVTSMRRETMTVPVGGDHLLPVIRLSVRYPDRTLTTWYWYQLGSVPVGDEYGLRLRLGVDAVLRRSRSLLLVRIAAVDDPVPAEFVHLLVPSLNALLARADRSDL